MTTKYERFEVLGDSWTHIDDDEWDAQTFTPSVAHSITKVALYMKRTGDSGNCIVSIRATDVDGKPTGEDLTSCTVDTAGWGNNTEGWKDFEFGTPIELSAGTKYAIVARGSFGTIGGDGIRWLVNSDGGYDDGCRAWGSDGVTWSLTADWDHNFQEWGDPLAAGPNQSLAARMVAVGPVSYTHLTLPTILLV